MIYLDYNASTPVDPAVREAMVPFLGEFFGNPSSSHAAGRPVREAVDVARQRVASMLGTAPEQIVFTSGGTEANNLVIKGIAQRRKGRGKHIITSAIEHPAVHQPCRYLADNGFEVSNVPVDEHGLIDPQSIIEAIRPDTILISIMHANNEVGTIQPIAEIAEIAREAGVLVHTDAAQSVGKIPTNVKQLGVDFLSVAGHKFYAPQGIGALYMRGGIEVEPLHHGAGHEKGRRAGTEPVPAIVGLGVAAQLVETATDPERLSALRDRLHRGFRDGLDDDVVLLGHPELRLPNTLAVAFPNRIGGEILGNCPELCASTGAACHSGNARRSGVLAAMNVPEKVAFGAVRFSVGRYTTEAEIDTAVTMVVDAVRATVMT